MIIPTILSGGAGTRLWPMSRRTFPKQFLKLASRERSLFQSAVLRLAGMAHVGHPILVCNQEHRFLIAEQVRSVGVTPGAILLEPAGRNTAPATACAALQALRTDAEGVLLVLPADHIILDEAGFRAAVARGLPAAESGHLVTFGIRPLHAETGFGYIQASEAVSLPGVHPVSRFVEKPDLDTAKEYLASGSYYWNSGIFMFRCDRFLAEMERHAPEVLAACRAAVDGATVDLDFLRLEPESFLSSPQISIDYAVMEKTNRAVVVPMEVGWSDLGSWTSLWEVGEADGEGNVVSGDVAILESTNCYLRSEDRLLAAVGLKDHVVVETSDAVLVAPMSRAQDIKEMVTHLNKTGRAEPRTHKKVFRPWGCYETINAAERFQVKRITVNPGKSLSMQMHHHRAEHWVIVKGTARVYKDEVAYLLAEDQSTYIPVGMKHRLENPGKIPLEVIEVQSGSYLEEDDIIRYDDAFNRDGDE
ncbi:MAG: mannose-1-phosphate guanylyltransferase/mannose-6-phosphate isomerase [Magnetococcales bacterium]|nr:mannose-1-phosphate guanylyltransferase/mannose-6-phosphate isomerase [Magnetococcales bacterium]